MRVTLSSSKGAAAADYVCPSCRFAARQRSSPRGAALASRSLATSYRRAYRSGAGEIASKPPRQQFSRIRLNVAKKSHDSRIETRSPVDQLVALYGGDTPSTRNDIGKKKLKEEREINDVLIQHSVLARSRGDTQKQTDIGRIQEVVAGSSSQPQCTERALDAILDAHIQAYGYAYAGKHTSSGMGSNFVPFNAGGKEGSILWKTWGKPEPSASFGVKHHTCAWHFARHSSTISASSNHSSSRHLSATSRGWRSEQGQRCVSNCARLMHSSTPRREAGLATAAFNPFRAALSSSDKLVTENPKGIRAQLRKWQELHGKDDLGDWTDPGSDTATRDGLTNDISRLPEENQTAAQDMEDTDVGQQLSASYSREGTDFSSGDDARILKPGDLVEIPSKAVGPMDIGVYVRGGDKMSGNAQILTLRGGVGIVSAGLIQYSIPGWVDPALIEPIIEHMPDVRSQSELSLLRSQDEFKDVSVPRSVSAPVVTQLLEFYNQAEEIYRQHSKALDQAHEILAHETDLRYGSLKAIAKVLLNVKYEQDLPLAALFVVRRALATAPLAFNFHKLSHRYTGYLQICSKQHVRSIDQVRGWIREWQEDRTKNSADIPFNAGRRVRQSPGAKNIASFLKKAVQVVANSRKTRSTCEGHVGPSNVQLPLTKEAPCVEVTTDTTVFEGADKAIIRFLETWACTDMFTDTTTMQSLPPILIQATGMYDNLDLDKSTAFLFLQELGVLPPFENRVRFDPHLLLPSSYYSKPLERLMQTVNETRPTFSDAMKDLRTDWGNLPVYCIDTADAEEIDDGISVEKLGVGSSGKEEFWIRIHIANPSAFIDPETPLAKMARHMGETVYLTERTYPMFPKWFSREYFSLDRNRPCLTISVRYDADGNQLETRIENGFIRNAIRITYDEVDNLLLDTHDSTQHKKKTYTVGPEVSEERVTQSRVGTITPAMREDILIMQRLTEKMYKTRRAAGGIFYDMRRPDINVRYAWDRDGLGGMNLWGHDRKVVHGDPRVELTTAGFVNWFKVADSVSNQIVREAMLTASDVAGRWCAERGLPSLFRGTVINEEFGHPQAYRDKYAMADNGEWPFLEGLQYLRKIGFTVMRPAPIKHEFLGLNHYAKVTSPLRRYGDIMLHWQIESALRQEARTGKSLLTNSIPRSSSNLTLSASHSPTGMPFQRDNSFLTFSEPSLEVIMRGLQPREQIIMRSKAKAQDYWERMIMYRKFHFPTLAAGTPLTDLFPKLHVLIINDPLENVNPRDLGVLFMQLNFYGTIDQPSSDTRINGEAVRVGDIWEAEVVSVNLYYRQLRFKLIRKHCENGYNDDTWRTAGFV